MIQLRLLIINLFLASTFLNPLYCFLIQPPTKNKFIKSFYGLFGSAILSIIFSLRTYGLFSGESLNYDDDGLTLINYLDNIDYKFYDYLNPNNWGFLFNFLAYVKSIFGPISVPFLLLFLSIFLFTVPFIINEKKFSVGSLIIISCFTPILGYFYISYASWRQLLIGAIMTTTISIFVNEIKNKNYRFNLKLKFIIFSLNFLALGVHKILSILVFIITIYFFDLLKKKSKNDIQKDFQTLIYENFYNIFIRLKIKFSKLKQSKIVGLLVYSFGFFIFVLIFLNKYIGNLDLSFLQARETGSNVPIIFFVLIILDIYLFKLSNNVFLKDFCFLILCLFSLNIMFSILIPLYSIVFFSLAERLIYTFLNILFIVFISSENVAPIKITNSIYLNFYKLQNIIAFLSLALFFLRLSASGEIYSDFSRFNNIACGGLLQPNTNVLKIIFNYSFPSGC